MRMPDRARPRQKMYKADLPRRKKSSALGCCFLIAAYCRISGVEGSVISGPECIIECLLKGSRKSTTEARTCGENKKSKILVSLQRPSALATYKSKRRPKPPLCKSKLLD